jgi:hypothetical protein
MSKSCQKNVKKLSKSCQIYQKVWCKTKILKQVGEEGEEGEEEGDL